MGSRLVSILAESADGSEENTQLGYFQEKSLMSGLSRVLPPLGGGDKTSMREPWDCGAALSCGVQLASSLGWG